MQERLLEINSTLNIICLCLCVSRVISEDEFEEGRKGGLSDEEEFEPYSEKRWVQIEKMGLQW